jgi:hypothetical protein
VCQAFTAELSRVFFVNLRDACKSFLDLFAKPPSRAAPPLPASTQASAAASQAGSSNNSNLVISDESDDVASLSYLVGWLQDQMTVFVTALARQVYHNYNIYITYNI